MATLMTFKSASGKKERCDAKCYNAKGEKCSCCCGGRNHGKGFVEAFKTTIGSFDEIVRESKNIGDAKLKITNIEQNKVFIRYFKEMKKQGYLFGEESEDQLLRRIENDRM